MSWPSLLSTIGRTSDVRSPCGSPALRGEPGLLNWELLLRRSWQHCSWVPHTMSVRRVPPMTPCASPRCLTTRWPCGAPLMTFHSWLPTPSLWSPTPWWGCRHCTPITPLPQGSTVLGCPTHTQPPGYSSSSPEHSLYPGSTPPRSTKTHAHMHTHTQTRADIYVYARTHTQQQTHVHKHRQVWTCTRMCNNTNKEVNLNKSFKWRHTWVLGKLRTHGTAAEAGSQTWPQTLPGSLKHQLDTPWCSPSTSLGTAPPTNSRLGSFKEQSSSFSRRLGLFSGSCFCWFKKKNLEQMFLQPMSAKRLRKGGLQAQVSLALELPLLTQWLRNVSPKKETDSSKTMGEKEEGAVAGWGWKA